MLWITFTAYKTVLVIMSLKGIVSSASFIWFLNPASAMFFSFLLLKQNNKKPFIASILFLDLAIPYYGSYLITCFFLVYKLTLTLYPSDNGIESIDDPIMENFDSYLYSKKLSNSESLKTEVMETLHDTLEIEPYIDIFESDNKLLKLNAINKLSDIKSSESVYLLKLAKADEVYEVKYFANNAIEKIEQHFIKELDSATEDILKDPKDNEGYNIRGYLYLIIVKLNIVDDETNNYFLRKALEDFKTSLKLNPMEKDGLVKICEIYNLLGMYKELIKQSSIYLCMDLENEEKYKILFYRAEAFYFLKDFAKVSRICKSISKFDIGYDLINRVTNYWQALHV